MTADVLLLVFGIGSLYYGADWLVRGSVRLAATMGIPPLVVGLTVVAFGTSAPELVACAVAVWENNPGIAIGNVMGSNLANIGLILGLTSLVTPVEVSRQVVRRDAPAMILVTLAIVPMVIWDETPMIGRIDGAVFLLVLILYLLYTFYNAKAGDTAIVDEVKGMIRKEPRKPGVLIRNLVFILIGSAGLVVGGYSVVEGAREIAVALGVSEVVIGLTLVAVGTSLPELATALVAAARKELSLAVGNVVGSNIFNFAAILGTVSVALPVSIDRSVLRRELLAVLFISLVLWGMMRHRWSIRRWEAAALLTVYLLLVVALLKV